MVETRALRLTLLPSAALIVITGAGLSTCETTCSMLVILSRQLALFSAITTTVLHSADPYPTRISGKITDRSLNPARINYFSSAVWNGRRSTDLQLQVPKPSRRQRNLTAILRSGFGEQTVLSAQVTTGL